MKATHAPRLWNAPHLTAYIDAMRRHADAHALPASTAEDRVAADEAVYSACGAPFGTSPLARWVWWHFGQWQTRN